MTFGEENSKKKPETNELVNETSPLVLPIIRQENEGGQEFNGASFTGAVFNLSTTIIGAGIMALPAAMKVLGLGLGIGLIVFVGALTERSIEMLLRFSKAGKVESYGGAMADAFGNGGRRLLQASVLVCNVGVLIVYTIIIGDVLSGTSSRGVHHLGVLEKWFGNQWWDCRSFVILFTPLFIFAPMASFKRIASLRFTSALAVALAVIFLVITAGIAVIKLISGSLPMPRLLPEVTDLASFWNLFPAVPVIVTAFTCHFNVHPIDSELEDSSMIQPVVQTSLALCSTIYIMTSFFGFLLFGNSTLDDVLANFDADLGIPYSSLLNNIVRISYTLHLMLVFPVIFYPLRQNLDGLLFPSAAPLVSDNRRFAWITIGLIFLIFLGANYIPSIWIAFQFTGATFAVSIGFIFPAAIALRDPHLVATKKDKIVSSFMILLAALSSLVAIYGDACTMFRKNPSPYNFSVKDAEVSIRENL